MRPLRSEGVMVIGSGNIVHNLRRIDWEDINAPTEDWARAFDETAKDLILTGRHDALIHYGELEFARGRCSDQRPLPSAAVRHRPAAERGNLCSSSSRASNTPTSACAASASGERRGRDALLARRLNRSNPHTSRAGEAGRPPRRVATRLFGRAAMLPAASRIPKAGKNGGGASSKLNRGREAAPTAKIHTCRKDGLTRPAHRCPAAAGTAGSRRCRCPRGCRSARGGGWRTWGEPFVQRRRSKDRGALEKRPPMMVTRISCRISHPHHTHKFNRANQPSCRRKRDNERQPP
ncbi:MAG: hypothetical protein MZU91_13595 [Desulfosudis oleivorans]|nr:hypothetical protein [Desulfosudis oleivorans]